MTNKNILIYGESYVVNIDEYQNKYHEEFNNLKIIENLGEHDRIVSLLNEISCLFSDKTICFNSISHGGYIPLNCSDKYKKIFIDNKIENSHTINLNENIKYYNVKNIVIKENLSNDTEDIIVDLHNSNLEIYSLPKIILCKVELNDSVNKNFYKVYELTNTNFILCVYNDILDKFLQEFHYYIKNETLEYDNLINLAMIVKNGGDSLENILTENLDIIDRWTILDTGSSDSTIDIINKVLVGKKKGTLYQEPFINFRESRNRCLDLAGKSCKYILTLDDTYIVKGNLRNFLNTIRGDQFSNSFSLYIESKDLQYSSNRIIESNSNLRYIYRIHEVISPKNNLNVMVPITHSHIFDYSSDYMTDRTKKRKEMDIELLESTIKEYPDDSRAYYYLGQTYSLLDEYELAYEYFIKRMNHKDEGFHQEKLDAIFEAARLANFRLNKDWTECEELYYKAYSLDKKRPDSLYFIGINYYLQAKNNVNAIENFKNAFEIFKKGFELGYPIDSQYSLKPTLSFYFLPKFLTELCYQHRDFVTGEKSSKLFLDSIENNSNNQIYKDILNPEDHATVQNWNKIFHILNIVNYESLKSKVEKNYQKKPYLCFLVDGGFFKWSGKDINLKGIGGSETFIIEMSSYIQKSGYYEVLVFCNCEKYELFECVQYFPLLDFFDFSLKNYIDICVISRYEEYVPYCLECENIQTVYLSLHDLFRPYTIIPKTNKLKKIFCLSNWHAEHAIQNFPIFKDEIVPFNYGIDMNLFDNKNNIEKIPYKFIYSSFPTRGLLPLLQMWPKILLRYPQATLHIHCDLDNKWSNDVRPDEMIMIKNIILNKNNSIFYHGWTSKKVLANNWLSSDIWFYPCTFIETFCLTALEAALTKTFVITRNIGALSETVGDRGVILDSVSENDPYNIEWQEKALIDLFLVLENKELKNTLIEKNYNWAKNMSWENRANIFLENYIGKPEPLILNMENISQSYIKNIDERFNYFNMYNWTNDLPPNSNSYDTYIKILDYTKWKYTNKKINVLEIGTFVGTSIIKILEKLPNSKGTVIDMWENYDEYDNCKTGNKEVIELKKIKENNIEKIFYNNIKISGIKDLNVLKGDSANILLNLISENKKFDFIYVDGSHTLLDSYSDLLLSFNLLNVGGIIVLDDFLYNKGDILNSPFRGIEYFLNKFKTKINVLHKDYRVFIEKI